MFFFFTLFWVLGVSKMHLLQCLKLPAVFPKKFDAFVGMFGLEITKHLS